MHLDIPDTVSVKMNLEFHFSDDRNLSNYTHCFVFFFSWLTAFTVRLLTRRFIGDYDGTLGKLSICNRYIGATL